MLKKLISKNNYNVFHYYTPNSEVIYTNFFIKAGSFNEKNNTNGVAHFLEHMNFQGFNNKNKYEILFETSLLGEFNAYTSFFFTNYVFNCLRESFDDSLKLMSNMIFNSTFPVSEIEREKKVILEEWRTSENNQHSIFYDEFCSKYFYDYKSVLGTEESINRITKNDLIDYRNKWYGKENMVIVVVGNITSEDLLRKIDEFVPDVSCSETPIYLNNWAESSKLIKINTDKFNQGVHYLISPLSKPIDFLNDSSFSFFLNTMNYSLYKIIREELGLCYGTGVNYFGHFDNQYFYSYTDTKKQNIELVGEKIKEFFNQVSHYGFPNDAYEICKKQVPYEFSKSLDRNSSIVSIIVSSLEKNKDLEVAFNFLVNKFSKGYITSKAKQINQELLINLAKQNLKNFSEFGMFPVD